jgi:hypothetical protein
VHLLRHATAILLLAIAACSASGTQGTGSRPQRAAPPPADYTHISSSDTRDSKNIQIGVNTGLIGSDEEGASLSWHFGLHFPLAVQDAKAEDLGATGDGLSAGSPLVFAPPVAPEAEVQSAVNLIASRAPDRRNMVGTLFRSPDRRYLLLIEFDTAAGANALYFDITDWAKARIES